MKSILFKIWDHLEEFFLIPTLIFSVGLIFMQVIMRHVFGNSLTWSEELARYLFIWQTWIGVSYSAKNGTHLRITVVKDSLPKNGQKILELLVTAVWIGFAIFVIIQGLSAAKTIMRFGQKSTALQIPMQIFYYSIPVGMMLMSIRLIERAVKNFLRKDNEEEGDIL